ncbi:MAG TPA: hypothetical protein VFV99_05570 [Kofleriaceae bacterium]|nr:hypothetical protein [Kofleriaceae bacterium]
MKAWLIPFSLVVLADTAHADQCAWIDKPTAQKAEAIVLKASKYIEFCEPCGEKAPGIPQKAQSVAVQDADGDYKEVTINGKGVDLAYTFVKTDAGHYRNLAALAGCPAEGVSPSLAIEDETPNGVMIRAADDTLRPQPPPPQPLPAPAAAPPQLQVPPQVYVYNTTRDIAWLPIALAACGGFVTGSALTLLVFAARRRRAMRPRAVDIAAR